MSAMAAPASGVLLLEDHPLVRNALRRVVAREGLAILAEHASVGDAERWLASLSPSAVRRVVALVDVHLPDGSGIEWVARWASKGLRAVVLTGETSRARVLQAMDAGALGFVDKTADPSVIREALAAAGAGRRYLCVSARRALEHLDAFEPALTRRETEVLGLIAAGRTNREIATQLGIALRTAETHRERLLAKLGAHNAADLTREALRRGLASR